jgi:hypothetical protein
MDSLRQINVELKVFLNKQVRAFHPKSAKTKFKQKKGVLCGQKRKVCSLQFKFCAKKKIEKKGAPYVNGKVVISMNFTIKSMVKVHAVKSFISPFFSLTNSYRCHCHLKSKEIKKNNKI